jgi:hypothetical protein
LSVCSPSSLWTRWHGVRDFKSAPVDGEHELFGFLTTEANGAVAPIHPKAMPAILTTPDEVDQWLEAEAIDSLTLQRPLPDDALRIVAKGEKEDGVAARPLEGFRCRSCRRNLAPPGPPRHGSRGIGAPSRRFARHYRRLREWRRTPSANNLAAIRAALESSGVIFIDENDEGPGVRLRFDLGLDTRQLIGRLELFADLSDQQLERIQKLPWPRFAVPRETIVREGERGDAVYFIASGAAEVRFPGRRFPLGSGDLFGELALLPG